MNTFKDSKVGDKVWNFRVGYGVIMGIHEGAYFPVVVEFVDGTQGSFTYDGRYYLKDLNPELFHSEVKFEVPSKPLPDLKVDTKVLVWDKGAPKMRRHFSHFEDGVIVCFPEGLTSFTVDIGENNVRWQYFEVVEDEQINQHTF